MLICIKASATLRVYSQGPGTTFHFAYALVDVLGGDGDKLREAMLYNKVLGK